MKRKLFRQLSLFLFIFICTTTITVAKDLPITGTESTLCDKINKEMLSIMQGGDYKAGTFSLSKNGRNYCSNGYGYQDSSLSIEIDPNRKMRIASVGKTVAAILIKDLFRRGVLSPDTAVFKYLKIKPYSASDSGNPQVLAITIKHLLDHKSGWDKKHDGYSKSSLKQVKKLSSQKQPTILAISKYMINQPLQYSSGSKRSYSNYGYALLKAVVEKATGESYVSYLRKFMKKHDVDIIESKPIETRDESETWYQPEANIVEFAFAISSADLIKVFTHYWINGDLRQNNKRSYSFYGSWKGTSAVIRQRKDGINFSVLINTRGKVKNKEIINRLDTLINTLVR